MVVCLARYLGLTVVVDLVAARWPAVLVAVELLAAAEAVAGVAAAEIIAVVAGGASDPQETWVE